MVELGTRMIRPGQDLGLAAARRHAHQACAPVGGREDDGVVGPPACPERPIHNAADRDRRTAVHRHPAQFGRAAEESNPSAVWRDELLPWLAQTAQYDALESIDGPYHQLRVLRAGADVIHEVAAIWRNDDVAEGALDREGSIGRSD